MFKINLLFVHNHDNKQTEINSIDCSKSTNQQQESQFIMIFDNSWCQRSKREFQSINNRNDKARLMTSRRAFRIHNDPWCAGCQRIDYLVEDFLVSAVKNKLQISMKHWNEMDGIVVRAFSPRSSFAHQQCLLMCGQRTKIQFSILKPKSCFLVAFRTSDCKHFDHKHFRYRTALWNQILSHRIHKVQP